MTVATTPEQRKANTDVLRGFMRKVSKAVGRENEPASRENVDIIFTNLKLAYDFGNECIQRGGVGAVDEDFWAIVLGARKSFKSDVKKHIINASQSDTNSDDWDDNIDDDIDDGQSD